MLAARRQLQRGLSALCPLRPVIQLQLQCFSSTPHAASASAAAMRDPTKHVKPNASLHASALTAPLPHAAAAALANAIAPPSANSIHSRRRNQTEVDEDDDDYEAYGAEHEQDGPLPFGALAQLPLVPSAQELLEIADRRARRLTLTKSVSGTANKIRDISLRQLRVKAAYILYRIDRCIAAAPPVSRLHPFERTVVGLTLGPETLPHAPFSPPHSTGDGSAVTRDTPVSAADGAVFSLHSTSGERAYSHALAGARSVRNRVYSALTAHSAVLSSRSKTPSLAAVRAAAAAAFAALETAVAAPAPAAAIDELASTFRQLRRLNVVNPRLPTVALVGAPNVGKSSLVRVLSSGRPEVQNYPFTTRAVAVGHVTLRGKEGTRYKCQVTDTPGLLPRRDQDRKKMELLTLAVLEHVPRLVVVFVVDPSGHCGTSLEDQLRLRQELRWRYHKVVPGERWVDVATKSDIWRDIRDPHASNTEDEGESRYVSPDVLTALAEAKAAAAKERTEAAAAAPKHGKRNSASHRRNNHAANTSPSPSASASANTGGVFRKATTTSTPLTPSSLSVPPHWRLADALASLPPRPKGFLDDDPALVAEVSVAAEPAAGVATSATAVAEGDQESSASASEIDEGLGQLQGALAWALLDLCEPEDGSSAYVAGPSLPVSPANEKDEEVRSGGGGRASKKEEDAELRAWLAARARTHAAAAAAAAPHTDAATVGDHHHEDEDEDLSGLYESLSGLEEGDHGCETDADGLLYEEEEGGDELADADIEALLGLEPVVVKAAA